MTSREFMYMNRNVFTFVSIFRNIGIATNRLYACYPLCTTGTFLPTNIGVRLKVRLVQPTKRLDRFLNGILARKRHFRGAFSAHRM